MDSILPFISCTVSFVFAYFVFRRYFARRGLHLLLWGIGMIFYAIGGLCEAATIVAGWHALIFRLWYLFGAILVAAWLGQGTVYLLASRRLANILMIILGLASLFAVVQVFNARLDPSLNTGSELSGLVIVSPGVRVLTPFFNIYGTLTLVGGAIWSAVTFWRKHILLHRAIGNVFIAVGAILPAFGGTFSSFGISGGLYLSELLGSVLMFIGFLRSTTPMQADKKS